MEISSSNKKSDESHIFVLCQLLNTFLSLLAYGIANIWNPIINSAYIFRGNGRGYRVKSVESVCISRAKLSTHAIRLVILHGATHNDILGADRTQTFSWLPPHHLCMSSCSLYSTKWLKSKLCHNTTSSPVTHYLCMNLERSFTKNPAILIDK